MPRAKGQTRNEREPSPSVLPPSEEGAVENPLSATVDLQSTKGWRWVLLFWFAGFGLIFLVEVYIMILSLVRWFGREG